MEDISCSLVVALALALQNVYGFSPNQIVFGKNLNFPNVMSAKPPALEGVTQS